MQRHLAKVYVTLSGCLALVAAGCWLGAVYPSQALLAVAQLVAFGCMLGLGLTQESPYTLVR